MGNRQYVFGLVGPKERDHHHQTVTHVTATTTATHQTVTVSQQSPGQQNLTPAASGAHVCTPMEHPATVVGVGGGSQASVQVTLCRVCQARIQSPVDNSTAR